MVVIEKTWKGQIDKLTLHWSTNDPTVCSPAHQTTFVGRFILWFSSFLAIFRIYFCIWLFIIFENMIKHFNQIWNSIDLLPRPFFDTIHSFIQAQIKLLLLKSEIEFWKQEPRHLLPHTLYTLSIQNMFTRKLNFRLLCFFLA